ncbi:AMIN-like domain-containing (lipo)protein [Krasilnikoviella flava]|uniref:AMIN-like domain-containing protein n=1 Tax=Krasilnikoviella flava TaxID=526729 RepID=A0A1T5KSY9_9MICO|nr:hypothetical protein [Krasilnikoviella flava]SKC66896.1 hypothetical protein SAMN04324258_2383 [Krasilnikoviella flava]
MTRTRATTTALASALTTVLVTTLAGCAGGGPADDGSPGTRASSATPTGSTAGGPTGDATGDTTGAAGGVPTADMPFAADASPDTAEPGADAALVVTDVRVGAHDGFDRVVFDLEGAGTPGWSVEYVDAPADGGSGHAVRVDGDAVLRVRLSGMAMPGEGAAEYGGATVDAEVAESVEEVVYRFWFEGYTTAFVGVDEPGLPFRAYALADPARVVVDVRHGGVG